MAAPIASRAAPLSVKAGVPASADRSVAADDEQERRLGLLLLAEGVAQTPVLSGGFKTIR